LANSSLSTIAIIFVSCHQGIRAHMACGAKPRIGKGRLVVLVDEFPFLLFNLVENAAGHALLALVVHVGDVPLDLAAGGSLSLKIVVGGLLLSAQVSNRL